MTADQLSSTLGLASIVLLAWPAFHAARYASKVYQLNRIGHLDRLSKDRAIFKDLVHSLQRLKDKWTPAMNFAFLAGTVLAIVSAAVSVYAAYCGP